MPHDKPWFGPMRWTPSPWFWKPIVPVSWQGWTLTLALLIAGGLLQLEPDLVRRGLAFALIVAVYGLVVALTWADEDGQPLRLRQALFSRRTPRVLIVMTLFVVAFVAAAYLATRAPRVGPPCKGPVCFTRPAR